MQWIDFHCPLWMRYYATPNNTWLPPSGGNSHSDHRTEHMFYAYLHHNVILGVVLFAPLNVGNCNERKHEQ